MFKISLLPMYQYQVINSVFYRVSKYQDINESQVQELKTLNKQIFKISLLPMY
jgi:hypothetical protein